MASYTVAASERGVHKTLVASTVDTVTFADATTRRRVEVINRDGSADLYFTFDGSTPTVGGNNTQMLPSAIGSFVTQGVNGGTVVKLISSGTPAYTVQEAN